MVSTAVRVVFAATAALALAAPQSFAAGSPAATTSGASEIGVDAATLNGVVTPHPPETTYYFEYGTTAYDNRTSEASAGAGREQVPVSARVGALQPDTTYRFRLVAYTHARTAVGDDGTFHTLPSPPEPQPAVEAPPTLVAVPPLGALAPPVPVFGERVNVSTRSGIVTVKGPGDAAYVPLETLASVPVGSLINAREGGVSLTSALPDGSVQTGIFHGGLFEVRQTRSSSGMTELVLRGRPVTCRRKASAARRHKPRALWGNVGHGHFRTRGRGSVATVRGTIWYVEDRCAGTLTLVRRGSVRVRDLRRHRTVIVRAGHRYLARARR